MALTPLKTDFSIFKEIGFEKAPVGVKYMFYKPKGIERLDKKIALCEMCKEAQSHDKPFYIDKYCEDCVGCASLGMLGPGEGPDYGPSGEIGQHCGVFRDNAANVRCMQHYQLVPPGAINYVVFAKLSALDFEPDLLIMNAPIDKMNIVIHALAYTTGCMIQTKQTSVFQCSWLYAYPFVSGNYNFIIEGIGHGSTARQVNPRGSLTMSIPSPWFPRLITDLKDMDFTPRGWDLPSRDAWLEEEEKMYGAMQKEFDEPDWS